MQSETKSEKNSTRENTLNQSENSMNGSLALPQTDKHEKFADQVVKEFIEGSKKALVERAERLKGTPFEEK